MKENIPVSSHQLDEIDFQIIRILQKNAKAGTKEIASQIGLTLTPAYERIKRLETRGVITGYEAKINPSALGKDLVVFCQVSLQTHGAEVIQVFETSVRQLTEVSAVFHVAGNYDYLLHVEVSGMHQYQNFLKEKLAAIPNIAHVQSTFVLSTLK